MEIDNVALPQSLSIARYLAKEFGLAGKTNLEQGKADAIVDTCADGFTGFVKVFYYTTDPVEKVSINIGIFILFYSS